MRSALLLALLSLFAAPACRPAAVEGPVAVPAAERAAGPAARHDRCGIVARLDLQSLSRISRGGSLDGLWDMVLPAGASPESRAAVVRATRAATLCRDLGGARRRDFGLVLEGDYPRDLLDRLMHDRAGFDRGVDGQSFVSTKITVAQPDEHRLVVTPTTVGDSWVPTVAQPPSSATSLLAISFMGDALQDIINAQAGVHARELEGVTALNARVAPDGKSLSVRLSAPDVAAARGLTTVVSGFVAEIRERAAKANRPLPEIAVVPEGADVAVTVDLHELDLEAAIGQLARLAGNRRSGLLRPPIALGSDNVGR